MEISKYLFNIFGCSKCWPPLFGKLTFGLHRKIDLELLFRHGEPWKEFRTRVQKPVLQPQTVRKYITPIEVVTRDFIKRYVKGIWPKSRFYLIALTLGQLVENRTLCLKFFSKLLTVQVFSKVCPKLQSFTWKDEETGTRQYN